MDIVQQANTMMRDLVPVLEREIAELEPVVERARNSFMHDGFAHMLGVRQRALASILRDLPPA